MSENDRERLRSEFAVVLRQQPPPLPGPASMLGASVEQVVGDLADVALRVLGPAVETTTGTVGADEWTERDVDRLAALIRGSSYEPATVTLADGARDAAVYLLGKGVVMPEEQW